MPHDPLCRCRNCKPPLPEPTPAPWWHALLGIGSDEHRQVYAAWRVYPLAMRYSLVVGALFGFTVATVIGVLLR